MTSLDAPVDPRLSWHVPEFGQMESPARLDELTTRIVAPNPSPMTLDGTNTYIVGRPGSGEAVVVDPGPKTKKHLDRVRETLAGNDFACAYVLITHHHIDHAEAGATLAESLGAKLAAPTLAVAGPHGRVIGHDDRIEVGDLTVECVATPGHCADHTAFWFGVGAERIALLSGDHVLGRGTSVVAHPDGNLGAYLESLRVVQRLGTAPLYPGHGPELTEDPSAVLDFYLAHREFRERQILAVLELGPQSVKRLVAAVYAEVPKLLWPAASLSTRAALDKLAAEERIAWDGKEASLAG